MTYEPLHHKYRPQTFADLVGQEAIATTLTNAIRQEKIAPAYLFTGSRGTGKTSSARILAKSLNCLKTNKPVPDPCGICDVCKGITKGSTLDVIEIDAASNTGVDNIREIIEKAQFSPVQCRYKVYVIDEVHMLSNAAFNALLKTLEEPPNRVVFVLATTDPQRVLPTIISRCQRFDFRRIPLDEMVKHLRKIAEIENINITGEAITLVGQFSQGGLRDAESLLDQLSLLAGEVTVERVWDLVGAVPERDLMELLRAIASRNTEGVLEKARNLMDRGREPLIVLQNFAGFYRDLLIAKTAPNRSDMVALTAPTWSALCEIAKDMEIATILFWQKHLKDSEVQIKNTTQPRLWLEVTLLGLLSEVSSVQSEQSQSRSQSNSTQYRQEKRTPPVQEREVKPSPPVQEKPDASPPPQGKDSLSSQPKNSYQQTQPEKTPNVSPTPVNSEQPEAIPAVSQSIDLQETWQQMLSHLQPFSTQELLRQKGHLISFDGESALISISPTWKNQIQEKLANIEAAFQDALKCKVRVKLEGGMATTATAKQADVQRSPSTPAANKPAETSTPPAVPPLSKPADPPVAASVPKVAETSKKELQPYVAKENNFKEEEVAIAAQRLAKAFDGTVLMQLEPPMIASNPQMSEQISVLAPELEPQPEEEQDDDEDVPF